MSAGERTFELTSTDGIKLHALLATPSSPRAAFILCHGITTNCDEHGAFPALRDRALKAGLAVARFDFRAHGQSSGTNEQLRLAGMRADVEQVVKLIDEQLGPDMPVIPLGVSFGGAAAVHAAAMRRCVGLVLWYAVVDYASNFGSQSSVPFTQQMRAARSDRDPDWSEMPLVGTDYYLPAALFAEMTQDRTLTAISELSIPVLGYYGSRDKLVHVDPLRDVAIGPNVELHVIRGAGHGFLLWRPWVVRRTVSWASRLARQAES